MLICAAPCESEGEWEGKAYKRLPFWVVERIDPATGAPLVATFVTARRSGGEMNSFTVTSLGLTGAGVDVTGSSFFSPRRADRTPMSCSGSSPFATRYRFAADLGAVLEATADRCR